MKVILTANVKGLGSAGDVVEVADGYGRNFLIPRGLAREASAAALKEHADRARAEAARGERERAEARRVAARLEGQEVVVRARAGEGGRLFGSVTAQDVIEAIGRIHGLDIDRRRLELPSPIKTLGRHPVRLRLHPDVTVAVDVVVVPGDAS